MAAGRFGSMTGVAGGSGLVTGGASGQGKRHVSALQAQQGRRKRLSAVNPDMPVISLEERQGNFEEWMKLATDNVSASIWSRISSFMAAEMRRKED